MMFPSHTVSVYVNNKPGVLMRVAQVFSRRGFNIDSLVVSSAMDGDFSRMTITCTGEPDILVQIIKQLTKLIDVVHCTEHKEQETVDRELGLIKLQVRGDERSDVLQLVDHFQAKTVDFTQESMMIQVAGPTQKLDAMIKMLSQYKIVELVRSGKLVMARGQEIT